MTKWFGWPEAEELNGHMIKRETDPAIKVEDRFRCEDCGAVTDHSSFGSGVRGCPARPASLNYLRIDLRLNGGADEVESMTLDQQKTAVRDNWLSFAKSVGMPVVMATDALSDKDRPERVMIFSVNGVIYELVYNEKMYTVATHVIGRHSTVQAAE